MKKWKIKFLIRWNKSRERRLFSSSRPPLPPTSLHSTHSFLLFATSCSRRSRKRRGFSFCLSFFYPLQPCSFIYRPIHPNFVSSSRSSWIMDVKIRVTKQPFWKSRVALTGASTLLVMNTSIEHHNHWYTKENFVFLRISGLFNSAVRCSKYRQEWQNKWIGKVLYSTFHVL